MIIDCRFSYEYAGGHITQAINLTSTDQVEEKFLNSSSTSSNSSSSTSLSSSEGERGEGGRPRPSTSTDLIEGGKTVLVFHCEFSAKRAPTSYVSLSPPPQLMRKTDRMRIDDDGVGQNI